MELKVISKDLKESGKRALPSQFNELVRVDLIRRAVEAIQGNRRQKYGSKPGAGMRQSAKISRRRRKYRGAYGKGISRVPRKIMLRRGDQMVWMGSNAPGTVGGRKAHAPKSAKNWGKKINVKERRKAIRSALSAVVLKDVVASRGHVVPVNYPFVIDSDFEKMSKTSDVRKLLSGLGFDADLSRSKDTSVRAGKGKRRGRRYRRAKSLLIVVSEKCPAIRAAENIAGVDIVRVSGLNAELLAPGAEPGRLTVFTSAALEKLDKERLFS